MSDLYWLSSAYAIEKELEAGSLVELLRVRQHVEVVLYALKRRSRSPVAETMAKALRDQAARIMRNDAPSSRR